MNQENSAGSGGPSASDEGVPRRDWLQLAVFGGLGAVLVALLYPVFRFLKPRKGSGKAAREVVAPYRVSDLKPDAEGKWPSPFNFGGKPCLLIKDKQGEVRAFNAVCTHVDCTVQFRPQKGDIFCSCHGGVYDLHGRNVAGPPPRPLEEYHVELRGKPGQEEIIVSLKS